MSNQLLRPNVAVIFFSVDLSTEDTVGRPRAPSLCHTLLLAQSLGDAQDHWHTLPITEAPRCVAAGITSLLRRLRTMDSGRRQRYVQWSIDTERALLAVLSRADVARIFDNPRHRDLCSMPPGHHVVPLINAEVSWKVEEFRAMAEELRLARDRLTRVPGVPTILDTNVLL